MIFIYFDVISNKWDMKESHTKVLLQALITARMYGGSYCPNDDGHSVSIDDIKQELSTREHITNKIEAKRIRQIRAKRTH